MHFDDSCTVANTVPLLLNNSAFKIKHTEGEERGVYAAKPLTMGTLVGTSPVLLFTQEEYQRRGRHDYTFKWPDGRIALALGLGSLFNHSDSPNVSYALDPTTESIRYTTTKNVDVDEEMRISYRHNLWFELGFTSDQLRQSSQEPEDGWGGLSAAIATGDLNNSERRRPCLLDGDPDEIVFEGDLPFTRLKVTPNEVEEDMDSVRTMQAWAVDIPDTRHIATMLKWLKKSDLDAPELGHLKRIRKHSGSISLLLSVSPDWPRLPENFNLAKPYVVRVPCTAALTTASLQLKCSLWPTVYTPGRKGEVQPWSRAKTKWARDSMQCVIQAAVRARLQGELPIAAYVPAPFEDMGQLPFSLIANDLRRSASHPLQHAVLNVIRHIADYRASTLGSNVTGNTTQATDPNTANEPGPGANDFRNGNHYLLTSLTIFTTHEPCIMCSMALLHSRVKEVFYFIPMQQTGGCGGLACLPKLEGVNHRFGISQWKLEGNDVFDPSQLEVSEELDA